MSAFGATAEDVTASTGVSAGTSVEIGSDAVTWASESFRLSAGKRLSPGADQLDWTSGALRPSSGTRVAFAKQALTSANKTPRLTRGVAVFLTKQSLAWSSKTPRLTTGGGGPIPRDDWTQTDQTFSLRAGKRLALSPDVLAMVDKSLRPSSGSTPQIPVTALTIDEPIPRLTISVIIRLHNEDFTDFTLGATGDDATAAEATCAAEPTTQVHYDPDQIFWSDLNLRPSSGGAGVVPSDDLSETDPAIEIGARRRKLRVWSILH